MKTINKSRLVILICGVLGLWACQDDDPIVTTEPVEIFQSVSQITFTSATLEASILNEEREFLGQGFCLATEKNPTVKNNNIELEGKDFGVEIFDLSPGQTYFTRPYVVQTDETIAYGEQSEFKTLSPTDTAWVFNLTFGENGEFGNWEVEVEFYEDGTTWMEDPNFPGMDTAYGTWELEGNDLTYHSGKVGDYEEYVEYHFYGQLIESDMFGQVTADHTSTKISFSARPK